MPEYAEDAVVFRKRRIDRFLPHLDRLASLVNLSVHRDDFDVRLVPQSIRAIIASVDRYTMTDHLAVAGLVEALDYLDRNGISGSVVEFGVWRGGSAMAAALRLKNLEIERQLFLFDTFEGMTSPGKEDIRARDYAAAEDVFDSVRCVASIEDVTRNLTLTEFPLNQIFFNRGPVEETVPDGLPPEIALARLDTDWYQSTLHELRHTWDRIPSGGVLIIDDYHYWKGSRQAVDEFFSERGINILLSRIGSGGTVIGVKP